MSILQEGTSVGQPCKKADVKKALKIVGLTNERINDCLIFAECNPGQWKTAFAPVFVKYLGEGKYEVMISS